MERVWESEGFFLKEADFEAGMNLLAKPVLDTFEEDFLENGSIRLHYYAGVHPREKASVVICHGFCEFFGKYHEMAYYLYMAGYSVFFLEQRGHGFSSKVPLDDESKVYVKSFDEYVEDLNLFTEQIVKKKSKTGRLILLGHSMGGCVSTLYIEKYKKTFERIILSSPMHRMSYGGKPEWMALAAVLYSKISRKEKEYAPGQRAFNPDNWFARSSALSFARWDYVQQERLEHPEYRTFGGTYAWTGAAIHGSKKSIRNASRAECPILLLEAGLDTLVNNEYHRVFAKKAQNVTLKVFENSKHEIFNAEWPDRIEFYRQIFKWLET